MSAHATRKAWLEAETGTLLKDAPIRIGLCYPNPYPIAMSSLGYQVIYRLINERAEMCAERIVLMEDDGEPISIETGRGLSSFEVLGFSVTYDLDIGGFFTLLDRAGIPIRREERTARHPLVMMGGPLTASNVLPFGPFLDFVVVGDGEVAVSRLLDLFESRPDRAELLESAAKIPGVWVPTLHGDSVPPVQKVTTEVLPAYGQIVTPHAELSDMFLVEASRGCPRHCKFCLVRSAESPMRESELDRVIACIPETAPRVGFVGAAVSEWTGIKEAIGRVVDMGKGVGVSSLRADRLDDEFVELLAKGGYRTMTVAADAPSQRMRNRVAKALRTEHLVNAAELGARHKMKRLKMYVVVGLPGETKADLDELIEFSKELAAILPLALGVSPLIPKLHTPYGDADFIGVREADEILRRLRHDLGGIADVRATSGRWAWVEYRLSQGGQDAGHAALEAWKNGGTFSAWKKAMSDVEERGGLRAARDAGLWAPAGMR